MKKSTADEPRTSEEAAHYQPQVGENVSHDQAAAGQEALP
jgi:hypothetical protein